VISSSEKEAHGGSQESGNLHPPFATGASGILFRSPGKISRFEHVGRLRRPTCSNRLVSLRGMQHTAGYALRHE
jgi:hypothetical protein